MKTKKSHPPNTVWNLHNETPYILLYTNSKIKSLKTGFRKHRENVAKENQTVGLPERFK
jgi:hypothetical protein